MPYWQGRKEIGGIESVRAVSSEEYRSDVAKPKSNSLLQVRKVYPQGR